MSRFQILFAFCVMGIAACGEEKHPVFIGSDCRNAPGGGCAVHTDGGSLQWDISALKPGQEYAMVIIPHGRISMSSPATHVLRILTNTPSAPISKEEAALSARVLNQNRPRVFRTPEIPSSNYRSGTAPTQNITDDRDAAHGGIKNIGASNVSNTDADAAIIHDPRGEKYPSRVTRLKTFSAQPKIFELKYDVDALSKGAKYLSLDDQSYLTKLDQCLKNVMPKIVDYLGAPPYSMNAANAKIGDSRLIVGLTSFASGDAGRMIAGLFSYEDLFHFENGMPFQNSNRSEFILLSRQTEVTHACVTTPHEYTHLLGFKYKGSALLAPESRFDVAAWKGSGIRPEYLGIDEARAHLSEDFWGITNSVTNYVYTFLRNMNGTPLATEAALNDTALNIRSRGLNVFFQYYAIRLAGGQINFNDAKMRDFFLTTLRSPKIGYQNIADYFHMSEDDLMKSFFVHLTRVARGIEPASELIPISENGGVKNSGINILSMSAGVESILDIPNIHPLQIEMPVISMDNAITAPSQSVNIFRYIAPSNLKPGGNISISTGGVPFTTYLIPL